jgi:hypothetical protein
LQINTLQENSWKTNTPIAQEVLEQSCSIFPEILAPPCLSLKNSGKNARGDLSPRQQKRSDRNLIKAEVGSEWQLFKAFFSDLVVVGPLAGREGFAGGSVMTTAA